MLCSLWFLPLCQIEPGNSRATSELTELAAWRETVGLAPSELASRFYEIPTSWRAREARLSWESNRPVLEQLKDGYYILDLRYDGLLLDSIRLEAFRRDNYHADVVRETYFCSYSSGERISRTAHVGSFRDAVIVDYWRQLPSLAVWSLGRAAFIADIPPVCVSQKALDDKPGYALVFEGDGSYLECLVSQTESGWRVEQLTRTALSSSSSMQVFLEYEDSSNIPSTIVSTMKDGDGKETDVAIWCRRLLDSGPFPRIAGISSGAELLDFRFAGKEFTSQFADRFVTWPEIGQTTFEYPELAASVAVLDGSEISPGTATVGFWAALWSRSRPYIAVIVAFAVFVIAEILRRMRRASARGQI